MAEEFRQLTAADGVAYGNLVVNGYAANDQYGFAFAARHLTLDEAIDWVKSNPVYGLFVDGELVSSITLRMPWGPNPGPRPVPHIGHFVTNAAYQGKGYARRMLNYVETAILRDQLRSPIVTLGTADVHPWLCRMYEHFGFKEFGRKKWKERRIPPSISKRLLSRSAVTRPGSQERIG